MAKKTVTKKVAAYPAETTIKTLEAQYGLDGKTLRVVIRGCGLRAPRTGKAAGEMGPTHKYLWLADNEAHVEQLDTIHAAIGRYIDTASKQQAATDDSDDE